MFHTSNSISNRMWWGRGRLAMFIRRRQRALSFKFKIQFLHLWPFRNPIYSVISSPARLEPIYCMLILCNITAEPRTAYIEQKKGLKLHLFTPLHELWRRPFHFTHHQPAAFYCWWYVGCCCLSSGIKLLSKRLRRIAKFHQKKAIGE